MIAAGSEPLSVDGLAAALGASLRATGDGERPVSVGNLGAVLASGVLVGTTLWEGAMRPLNITVPGDLSDYDVLEFTVAGALQYFRASTVASNGSPHYIRQGTTNYNIIFGEGDGSFTVSVGNTYGSPTITKVVGYKRP